MSNEIFTRIKQKHDIESNWLKTSFVPMQSEIIVYDPEVDSSGTILEHPSDRAPYTYARFKIGDGFTDVNELTFASLIAEDVAYLDTEDNTTIEDTQDNTIKFTPQTLTEEQKAQARENINAANKSSGVFYIEGNSTTAGTWTGTCSDVTEYYDGLTIVYKISIAGASGGTTLNINGLGAKNVRRNTSNLTTHYGVNSLVMLTYTTIDGVGYWQCADYDSDTKTRSSNKTDTKMYLIGASSQSTSGQTTYSNSNCYIGTDNCLYSGGKKVADASSIPTSLKNPNALTINGKTYDGSEPVNIEISGASASEVTALGQTPITLAQDANVKLVANGECNYTAKGVTVADVSTASAASTSAKLTQTDEYIEFQSTGGSAWYGSHVDLTMGELTVGEKYRLIIDLSTIELDPTNKITDGHYILKDSSGTTLVTAQMNSGITFHNYEFTATTASVILVCYPAGGGQSFTAGESTSRATDIYINRSSAGTTRTDIINKSGTFTDSLILGPLSKGITITSDPSCEVYNTSTIGDETTSGATSPLTGKTIVCFGDSLFGMYRGSGSTPSYVAKRTGAIVHNVGFGGCRMSVHPTTGYAAFSMWALAKAIAENDWTTQDAEASSGSDYFPEQLALLKSIDFNSVDAVVVHYGTNDFTGNVGIDNTSNQTDYNTLCGALRYSVEKLLTAYPHLRIFVSVPAFRYWEASGTVHISDTYTNSSSKTLVDFVEALINVAKEYNLPVIDSYYGLGINKTNASIFLADGVHHNVEGRKRFGGYIGSRIIAEY